MQKNLLNKNDTPKAVAETYVRRVWDEQDLSAIEELAHKGIVIHSLLGDFQGPEKLKDVVQTWLKGFPDLQQKNLASIAEGDLVALHWQAKGTHQGEFKGIKPTGKAVAYAGVTLYRVREGKIIEYWAYLDMKHLLDQISPR